MSQPQTLSGKYFESYSYFSRTLRGWMVAYGIGAPILVATQKELTVKLLATGYAKEVVLSFLFGVFIQILSALLYKYSFWMLYLAENDSERRKDTGYLVADWLFWRLWPTACFDIFTVLLFMWPTFVVLTASAA
jgi:hypothetical protein